MKYLIETPHARLGKDNFLYIGKPFAIDINIRDFDTPAKLLQRLFILSDKPWFNSSVLQDIIYVVHKRFNWRLCDYNGEIDYTKLYHTFLEQ